MELSFTGTPDELESLFATVRCESRATLSDDQLATLRAAMEKRKISVAALQAAVDAAAT